MHIYCVSPEYLEPLSSESNNYEVSLVIHGSYEAAYNNLIWLNSADLCSLVIVSDQLPKGPELGFLIRLINSFNMISEHSLFKKRIVVALKEDTGLSELLGKVNITHLEVYGDKFEIITDLYLRREILGTALTSFLYPYKDNGLNIPKFTSRPAKGLGYNSVFPPLALKSLRSVKLRPSFEETVTEDKYLEQLKMENVFYYSLRLFAIQRMFQNGLLSDKYLDGYIESTSDEGLKFSYSMLYEYTKRSLLGVES